MHQNIQHFYNHTDTLLDVKLSLEILGTPTATVVVNGIAHTSLFIEQQVELHNDIDIEIQLSNKDYATDNHSAIVINDISVDGFSIIDDFIDIAEYTNDHNWCEPTTHIGFNGKWKLHIPGPFYITKHHQTGQGWLIYPKK